jgi:hypothetical protein
VFLRLQGIGCSYNVNGATKVVLQDIWGKAYPGQMQVCGAACVPKQQNRVHVLCLQTQLLTLQRKICSSML